jgi:hypothetical protein
VRAIRQGLILLFLQLLLVLSVAGKYLYERQTRPRVWTRATQFDPALPLRGRYLGMTLLLDACGLPRDTSRRFPQYYRGPFSWRWNVSLTADKGKLLPTVDPHSRETLTLLDGKACDRATLDSQEMLFIPDSAQLPFPLRPGQELWVEVTLPAGGPPRPLQIALSSGEGFRSLGLK